METIMARGSLGSARRVRLRVLFALVLAVLLSGLCAAPASAGPEWSPPTRWVVAPDTFTVAPAVGAPIAGTLRLWGNGSATATRVLPWTADRLVFQAEATRCEGSPRLEVRVDGQIRSSLEIAGAGSYAVAGRWFAGPHQVSFALTNDRLRDRCDRNLTIHNVRWESEDGYFGASTKVFQKMDLRGVTFAPTGAGVSSAGGATLWSTGSFTGALDSGEADRLDIKMRSAACEGTARFRLRVDGELITERAVPPPRDGASSYTAERTWTNGMHTIEIAFLNDVRTATCDRNLSVLGVSFAGIFDWYPGQPLPAARRAP
jgi:hypothetical protein